MYSEMRSLYVKAKINEKEICDILTYVIKAILDTTDEFSDNDSIDANSVRSLVAHISFDLTTLLQLVRGDEMAAIKDRCDRFPDVGAVRIEFTDDNQVQMAANQGPKAEWPAITSPGDDPEADSKDPASWN
jgi:hypothetical protein